MAIGKKTGGRKKGSLNKATSTIKELLDSNVDFNVVIGKLYELAQGVEVEKSVGDGETIVYEEKPDVNAARALLAYRYGQPKQEIEQTGNISLQVTRKILGNPNKPEPDLHSGTE